MIRGLLQKFQKPKRRTQAERVLKLRSARVYYLPITKVGSTYLKNLFYYLDHATEHGAGIDIHSSAGDLLRAKTRETKKIQQSPYAFAVIRNPVDRFLSLYFDKIYGDGPNNFVDIRNYLASEIGLNLARGIDADAHRENCVRFIDWLSLNLDHETDVPINHHWRRQSSRLQRANTLNLEILTLDDLDWQLPKLLGGAVPNIRQAMAAVKSDNRTEKPYTRTEILDAGLQEKIETAYAYDKKLYERAKAKWCPWQEYSPQVGTDARVKCFTAKNLPVNYIATQKAGCTYVRNVLYALEHGEAYHTPLKIHVEGLNSHSNLTEAQLADEVSFFVVRDPTARFFSLYFDKVHGTGERSFPWIAKRLMRTRNFVIGDDLTIDQHRHNVGALLSYVERQLRLEEPTNINPHWGMQSVIGRKAIRFGLQPLLLEKLDEQWLQIAEDRIAGLQGAMDMVQNRNASTKPVAMNEILTPEIAQRISALYAADQAMYERVKTAWADTGRPPVL